jgi:hypothetical protein
VKTFCVNIKNSQDVARIPHCAAHPTASLITFVLKDRLSSAIYDPSMKLPSISLDPTKPAGDETHAGGEPMFNPRGVALYPCGRSRVEIISTVRSKP